MSETLLNFLNKDIVLSKKIINIDTDFHNGFLYAELLLKNNYIKEDDLSGYIIPTKTLIELRHNYNILKEQLKIIGIHLDDFTMNELISCTKGAAAKLLYKIKTQIDRRKIKFDVIMDKIMKNDNEDQKIKNKSIEPKNKTYYNKLRKLGKSNVLPSLSEISTFYGTSTNFRNLKSNYQLNTTNNKVKLEPLKLNEIANNKINNYELNSLNLNQILEVPDISKSKKSTKKLKTKVFSDFDENKLNTEYMKYSCLDRNTLRIGLDIKEVDPKLKKQGVGPNNDYIPTNVVLGRLRQKVNIKKEEQKKILEEKKFLTEEQKILKYSILKARSEQEGNETGEKMFKLKFDKNTHLYKMHEYEKYREQNFPLPKKIDSKLLYDPKNSENYIENLDRNYKTVMTNFSSNNTVTAEEFNIDEFLNKLNNESVLERQKITKAKNLEREKNEFHIRNLVELLIDFTDECYNYQRENNCDLVDLPEYKHLLNSFIEGKIFLKPIKNKIGLINLISDNSVNVSLQKVTSKNNITDLNQQTFQTTNMDPESEFNDYINFRGEWSELKYIPKNLYGTMLHVYQVLGDDITRLLNSGKIIAQGIKSSILLKMKNEDFEMKEEEKDNVLLPKENTKNRLFGEIIELNYDNLNSSFNFNAINNYIGLKNLNNTRINFSSKSNIVYNKTVDLSYIPIRICLIGHSFSGRKTQAKLICNKYKNIKSYSIEEIIKGYSDEYDRLHTPLENNPKFKTMKKNQIDQLKQQREEELKNFEEIDKIMDPLKQGIISELSDETKINIIIKAIKNDFPYKEENIISEEILKRNTRKQEIENLLNQMNTDDKKSRNKLKDQQFLLNELNDLTIQSYVGFILVDFPNTYSQYVKLENIITGFVQEIDKPQDLRDLYLDALTKLIDKPYANISNLCPEVINFLGHNKSNTKSVFNNYIWLEINEEETLKRVNNRLLDPNTGIIYHTEFDPPPAGDKKLNDRLVNVTEPSEEFIKNELKKYDIEFPKILSYISLFHNLNKINVIDKNEIFNQIGEILSDNIKKFEERENKDYIGTLNNIDPEESETVKYYKRLHEIKKIVNREISENIIVQWAETAYNYSNNVKEFLNNFNNLKKNILEKMDNMQEVFIGFLNAPTQKKKLVEFFQKKYEVFMEKYHQIKKNKLVQDEFQKDIVELTENFWEIIQMKKRDAINELNTIKNQNFIENQSIAFCNFLINLYRIETNYYIKKINLIRKFYYEFDNSRYSEKCPYEYPIIKNYNLQSNDLLKDSKDLAIFNINTTTNISYSPKIDKVYKNCFKFLFSYDIQMEEIAQKEKDNYALNTSGLSTISKKKLHKTIKKAHVDQKGEMSIFSESKNLISHEEEMKAALNNEKIKYKIRLAFLKYFGEHFLREANNISEATFQNLDNCIVKSVDAQNNAMNSLMKILRDEISKTYSKISYNIELDSFNIYLKHSEKFKEFNLDLYQSWVTKKNIEIENQKIKNEKKRKIEKNTSSKNTITFNKNVDIPELNKIYLDLKNYEIQDNYVTLISVIDIVFKKHLFTFKSNAFVDYLKDLPYYYLNSLISKFIYKTEKGRELIRIDQLFTILAVLNLPPPKNDEIKKMVESVKDKLKFHCFLSKDDFMKCNLWFEKNENINENNINENNLNKKASKNLDLNNNNENNIVEENSNKENNVKETDNKENNVKDNNIKENNNKEDNKENNNKEDNKENKENKENNNKEDNKENKENNNKDDNKENKENKENNNIPPVKQNNTEISNLLKNLTPKTENKNSTYSNTNNNYSRKASQRRPSFVSKLTSHVFISPETLLKEFLFNVNKNYDGQINFVEFLNVLSLKFIKNFVYKKKYITKHIDKIKLMNLIKKGELPTAEENVVVETKGNNTSRKRTTSFASPEKEKMSKQPSKKEVIKNISKKRASEVYDSFSIGSSNNNSTNVNKIIYDGDYIFIGGKKYNIESFQDNIFIEYTYFDELVEEII